MPRLLWKRPPRPPKRRQAEAAAKGALDAAKAASTITADALAKATEDLNKAKAMVTNLIEAKNGKQEEVDDAAQDILDTEAALETAKTVVPRPTPLPGPS